MSREAGYAELDRGVQLLTLGDWAAARDAFAGVLEAAETPEAHDGLARALWWLGLPDEGNADRELHRARGVGVRDGLRVGVRRHDLVRGPQPRAGRAHQLRRRDPRAVARRSNGLSPGVSALPRSSPRRWPEPAPRRGPL